MAWKLLIPVCLILCGCVSQTSTPPAATNALTQVRASVKPATPPMPLDVANTNGFNPPGGIDAWRALHPPPTNLNNVVAFVWSGVPQATLMAGGWWFDCLQESQDFITWSNVGNWYLVSTNDITELWTNDFQPVGVFRVERSPVLPGNFVTQ